MLKLPKEKKREIVALGDYWDILLITERELRDYRRGYSSFSSITGVLESSEANLAGDGTVEFRPDSRTRLDYMINRYNIPEDRVVF